MPTDSASTSKVRYLFAERCKADRDTCAPGALFVALLRATLSHLTNDEDSLRALMRTLTLSPESDENRNFSLSSDQFMSLSAADLGFLYERYVLPTRIEAHQNKEGIVYTPQALVDRLCQQALQAIPIENQNFSALDPACGCGIFLLTLFDTLRVARTPLDALRHLHGVDKDPMAVVVTRLSLLLEAVRRGLPHTELLNAAQLLAANIRTGNGLLAPEQLDAISAHTSLSLFSYAEAYPKVMRRGGFDLIVGNPPYGISRDGQIDAEENLLLQKIYARYECGKVNKYLLFMARGLELLKPKGMLSFVVPNAWLGIRSGRGLRRILVTSGALRTLTILSKSTFQGISVEPVVLLVQREGMQTCYQLRTETCATIVPLSVCQAPDFLIPALWQDEASSLQAKLALHTVRIGDKESPLVARIALQAYAAGKGVPPQTPEVVRSHPFHCTAKISDDAYPYLEGSDIRRYSVHWSGRYLRYGQWLAEPQQLSRFQGPRIVVREILGKSPYLMQAAFISETMLYNKSVLHLLPKEGVTEESVWAVLAILNSSFASLYLKNFGRKTQRSVFPKLVNDDLKSFPLPREWDEVKGSLALKAKALSAESDPIKRTTLDRSLDTYLWQIYGLSENLQGDHESIKAVVNS